MFIRKSVLIFLVFFIFGINEIYSHPLPYTREKMERFLNTIQDQFETRYAPYEWKSRELGWDLSAEIFHAKKRLWLLPHVTIKDFQGIVRDLIYSTKDYHVGVIFHHTESATLPFTVKSFEGDYYITSVDFGAYPLERGDELLKMNGKDVDTEIAAILQQITSCNPMTDQSFAEIYLTSRRGMMGIDVPKGAVTLEFRKAESGEIKKRTLRWRYTSNSIQEPPFEIKALAQAGAEENDHDLEDAQEGLPKMLWRSNLRQQMLSPHFAYMEADDKLRGQATKMAKEHPNELGKIRNFLPDLGEVLWRGPNKNFYSYIFLDEEGRKIGYVRIPIHMGGIEGVEEFGKIIKAMEKETEALVIDQQGNPGGSAFYMYALLTFLTDKPVETPLHQLAITQKDVENALECLKFVDELEKYFDVVPNKDALLDGYPVTRENVSLMREYCNFILDEWAMGHYITQSTHLWAIREVMPNPKVRYTKPILVLVNELCISCGDFFPAILQDAGRATIMGVRTAGAGGAVVGFTFDNPFGIKAIHLTASIAERPNGEKLENSGTTPDVEYRLTTKDFFQDYLPFQKAILEEVDEMLFDSSIEENVCIESIFIDDDIEEMDENNDVVDDDDI